MIKVYLAGSLNGGWQDTIKKDPRMKKIEFFDPSTHGLDKPEDYTIWDLRHLKESDVVLGYYSIVNPSGFGMCIEIGYAKALNKKIILIDEVGRDNWAIVRECCTVVVKYTNAGIVELLNLITDGDF